MNSRVSIPVLAVLLVGAGVTSIVIAQDDDPVQGKGGASPVASPAPQDAPSLGQVMKKMGDEKAAKMQAARDFLASRYDLADKPSEAKTTRGTPIQEGVRVKLPAGMTWEKLGAMTADEIKKGDHYPAGFLPMPGADHAEGGMVFPQDTIDEIKKQTQRDLTRFDIEFEIPKHLMPEFPPAIFLTTHPEAGDISQGKLVTSDNFHELFKNHLNPKQLDGLRILVTPFPQQQFNATDDRRTERASLGVSCLDCHINGHTNGATHLVGDIRPQDLRHRIETPSLRGVNVQRLFGSQRALKSVEDFTEFEQRAAYFDGDPQTASKKGISPLDRGTQVHHMGEFQNLLDFPPAPKLDVFGRLDLSKATESEKKGEALFFGKAKCATCHTPPYYTDNTMHDLQTERFYTKRTQRGHTMVGDGKIKTFPLRGIKESPPYMHDARLMTLEDTVEFFNVVLGTKLTPEEKVDLVAFLRVL